MLSKSLFILFEVRKNYGGSVQSLLV